MKNIITLFILCCTVQFQSIGQVRPKKPSIMVLPSKAWCNAHGYTIEIENQGIKVIESDFASALLDKNLNAVITEIGSKFQREFGFELKLLSATLDKMRSDAAIELALSSKSGSAVSQSPLDKILSASKPDIVLELDYTVNSVGGVKNSVEFRLTAIDSYTSKQIGNANGVGEPSFETVHSKLLLEAVHVHVTNLANQMQTHFDDQLLNGREIVVTIMIFDDNDFDLDSDVDTTTYEGLITNWFRQNTVNQAFKVDAHSETRMPVSEVRIPMFNEKGNPIDANDFVKGLQSLLALKSGVKVKKISVGLGQAILVMGNQ
ncbi:MAG: hypothetical protein H6608_05900 [Flavobacteriales bacterium]|nr:hypothetical protein [Flavobacteriales bacterium]